MAKKIFLIRHGLTDWNKQKRYCGAIDLGLNRQGRLQAEKLKQRLNKEGIEQAYCSPKLRARQTARIIFGRRKIRFTPGLREIDFGLFEGLSYREISAKWPGLYKKWLKNPFKVDIPKGESIAGFKKRVVSAFKRLLYTNKNKTIAIVTHGGVTSVILNYVLKKEGFWKYAPSSASLTALEYKNKKTKLLFFNDISHLNPAPSLRFNVLIILEVLGWMMKSF